MADSSTITILIAMTLVAAAGPLVVAMYGKFTPFHPAFAFGLPYLLVTTGPAIRYLVWGVAPYGIHLEMLAPALGAALAAQTGIFLGCVARLRWNRMPDRYAVLRRPRRFRLCVLALCLGIVVLNLFATAFRWQTLATVGKADLGGTVDVWQRAHYAGLLLLLALTPAMLVADQALERKPVPWLTRLVLGLFGLVCLLAGERDIALVVVMIPVSWFALRRPETGRGAGSRRLRVLLQGAAAFAVVAILLVVLEWARSGAGLTFSSQVQAIGQRSKEDSVLQSILSLGSNLFIVSRVVEWVPAEVPYEHGMTYVHTLVNMLPSFLLPDIRYESLLTWFKMRYAPTSDSGYGFGMEAEAFLNFGYAGPVVVFALWAWFLCRLYDGYRKLPGLTLYRYAYTFLLPFSLYSIRGDSVMLVKGFCYSAGLVLILARVTGMRKLVRMRRRPASHAAVVIPPATLAPATVATG